MGDTVGQPFPAHPPFVIVNTARIDRCCPAHVEIGGMTIEISRKYREAARRRLTEQAANA